MSYVVNGRDERRVSAETRRRVLEAARQLGYAPNTSARNLRRRRTERVCLVISQIGVPAHDQLSRDLHAAADAVGYGVITMVVDSDSRARKTFDLLRQRIADGAILAVSAEFLDPAELKTLAPRVPLVVVDNAATPDGFDVVRTPEREACGKAFDLLFGSGRRRVGFIGHQGEVAAGTSLRLDAYVEALERHGIPRDDRLIVPGADARVTGYHAAAELLALPDPPDAIFAASDRAAISALWAVRDSGRAVPDDVAVIGVGNIEEGLITRPPLTTVGQPRLDYSEVARLLFDRIHAEQPPRHRELVLPWELIIRGSA